MKKLLCMMLLFCLLIPLFAQNKQRKMTLDNAINDFAIHLISSLSSQEYSGISSIGVISFETDRQVLADYFIDKMVGAIGKNDGNIYERSKIEIPLKEVDFSLNGYISDENAQRIGHFVGVDIVVYGSLTSNYRGNAGTEYQMTITGTITETGKIVFHDNYDLKLDSRLKGLLGITGNEARLWTIGASVGSSFSRPLIIGTLHGTIAPFRYSFLELGIDAGFISRKANENYYSIYPFAHYALFWPFDRGGLYIGAGIGYMFGEIIHPGEREPVRIIAADGIVGANIMNVLDVSYTLRTTFSTFSNKFSIGYTYRFK